MNALITGLLGGIIGSFITHWFAERRDREKEFQDAGKQFREAFLEAEYLLSIRHPEHSKIYTRSPDQYEKAYLLLCRFHEKHYTALVRFESYLSKPAKDELQKLWYEYCCFDAATNQKYATYEDYKSTDSSVEEWSKRELALERIKAMFKCTWLVPIVKGIWYKRP
jgi:hypothetical protein